MFLTTCIILLLALLVPETAWAWGPATHLELGQAALRNIARFAPAARAVIEAWPADYLYGHISADIVVGKNLVEELKHCHNWKLGFRLLRKAKTDSQKSFAWGYLSHLAADTVAHNHFIPEMMIRSFSARTLRHIYWEMRFDTLADKKVWELPKKMVKKVHRDNDRLLDSVIEDSPLPFKTNKTIFNSVMSIQRVNRWHRMMDLLSSNSKWTLDREMKEKYFKSSLDAVLDLLEHGHKAKCVKKDPTGRHSLNSAKFIRKKLKNIKKRGRDWHEALENALQWVRLHK